eukprot:Skav200203  [mRNA]  locus=scaffold623:468267:484815:- [translate_table: standard]
MTSTPQDFLAESEGAETSAVAAPEAEEEASDEECLQLMQLRCVSRWWRNQFAARNIEPLYGFALPAVAHVAMHWGMFTEHGVVSTQTWHQDSEVVWITDPDEDHGDVEGYSEGSRISPWQAYELWHALMKRAPPDALSSPRTWGPKGDTLNDCPETNSDAKSPPHESKSIFSCWLM